MLSPSRSSPSSRSRQRRFDREGVRGPAPNQGGASLEHKKNAGRTFRRSVRQFAAARDSFYCKRNSRPCVFLRGDRNRGETRHEKTCFRSGGGGRVGCCCARKRARPLCRRRGWRLRNRRDGRLWPVLSRWVGRTVSPSLSTLPRRLCLLRQPSLLRPRLCVRLRLRSERLVAPAPLTEMAPTTGPSLFCIQFYLSGFRDRNSAARRRASFLGRLDVPEREQEG